MGRRKVEIKRIQDDRARKVTFAKRKHGLVKKAMELSLLCDCDIALLIFTREKPDQKFYKYTSFNIESILEKLSKNPQVLEDRHNAQYDALYVKKGKEGLDPNEEKSIPVAPFNPMTVPMSAGYPVTLSQMGNLSQIGTPFNAAAADAPGPGPSSDGAGSAKKNLTVEIPGGADLAQLGGLNTPNSTAMFNQLGSSLMGPSMQLSPGAMYLGGLGSAWGIGGPVTFGSPNAVGNSITPHGFNQVFGSTLDSGSSELETIGEDGSKHLKLSEPDQAL